MVRNRSERTAGFTLVEVMVALAIAGLSLAAVAASISQMVDAGSAMQERTYASWIAQNKIAELRLANVVPELLSSLIELANDEASIQGRDYGLEFLRSGYRFVEFDPLLNQWYEMIGDDFLRPRQIEEGLEFELIIEDRRVLLDESAAETQRDEDDTNLTDDYIPHILIMSSGDVSPFELRFLRPNDRTAITLTMSLAGELEIQGDGQEPF